MLPFLQKWMMTGNEVTKEEVERAIIESKYENDDLY